MLRNLYDLRACGIKVLFDPVDQAVFNCLLGVQCQLLPHILMYGLLVPSSRCRQYASYVVSLVAERVQPLLELNLRQVRIGLETRLESMEQQLAVGHA